MSYEMGSHEVLSGREVQKMLKKINLGFVFIAWLIIEMVGIVLITPGPLVSLLIDLTVWLK